MAIVVDAPEKYGDFKQKERKVNKQTRKVLCLSLVLFYEVKVKWEGNGNVARQARLFP